MLISVASVGVSVGAEVAPVPVLSGTVDAACGGQWGSGATGMTVGIGSARWQRQVFVEGDRPTVDQVTALLALPTRHPTSSNTLINSLKLTCGNDYYITLYYYYYY